MLIEGKTQGCQFSSKLSYRFNAILVKFPISFFCTTDKLILKCTSEYKGPRIPKSNLEKKKLKGKGF